MSQSTLTALLSSKDKSLFGGLRAHADLALLERLHEYPGPLVPGLAYEPEAYGYESDGVKGSIAHDANARALIITVSDGAPAAKSRLRTHDLVRYQPGCMPEINITGATSSAWTTLKCIRRSKADGTLRETTEATFTNFRSDYENRYTLRYAYLGVQAVEWSVNGTTVCLKDYSGTQGALAVPYMGSPNLPISVEEVNHPTVAGTRYLRIGVLDDEDGLYFQWELTGNFASQSFSYKCASARLVGGSEYAMWANAYRANTIGTSVTATLTPLFSLRPKSTINGVASRAQLFPEEVSFTALTKAARLSLVVNPTLTGATWAAATDSQAAEVDAAANVITGGTLVWSAVQAAGTSGYFSLTRIFTLVGRKLRRQAFTGTADILTLAVQRAEGTNADVDVVLNWSELR